MSKWDGWPYVWSPDRKVMAHYKLWIDWFTKPNYFKKGLLMNDPFNKLASKLENIPAEIKQAIQTAEDRGETAKEVKVPAVASAPVEAKLPPM